MSLTPQERAEKIRSILSMAEHYNEGYGGGPKEMWDQTMQEVAAQISEAERETVEIALKNNNLFHNRILEESIRQVRENTFNAAKEKACKECQEKMK